MYTMNRGKKCISLSYLKIYKRKYFTPIYLEVIVMSADCGKIYSAFCGVSFSNFGLISIHIPQVYSLFTLSKYELNYSFMFM